MADENEQELDLDDPFGDDFLDPAPAPDPEPKPKPDEDEQKTPETVAKADFDKLQSQFLDLQSALAKRELGIEGNQRQNFDQNVRTAPNPAPDPAAQKRILEELEADYARDPVMATLKMANQLAEEKVNKVLAQLGGTQADMVINQFRQFKSSTDEDFKAVEGRFDKFLSTIPKETFAGKTATQINQYLEYNYRAALGDALIDARSKKGAVQRKQAPDVPNYGGGRGGSAIFGAPTKQATMKDKIQAASIKGLAAYGIELTQEDLDAVEDDEVQF